MRWQHERNERSDSSLLTWGVACIAALVQGQVLSSQTGREEGAGDDLPFFLPHLVSLLGSEKNLSPGSTGRTRSAK